MSDLRLTIKRKTDYVVFNASNKADVDKALKRLDNVTTASDVSYHCNNGTRPYYKSSTMDGKRGGRKLQ